jgi:GntR family transcriptional regulator
VARRRKAIASNELRLPTELNSDRGKGEQIREVLENLVAQLGPGTALPSERQLAELYGVARMTVRAQIRSLAADGVLTIKAGSGVYVADPPHPTIAVGHSFSHEMRQRGLTPGSVLLEHNVLLVTQRLSELLGAPVGSRALRLVRLRTADEVPMGIERTTVSLAKFPDIDKVDFETASLYDTLRRQYGVEPYAVEARGTAVLPSEEEAELLGIAVTEPCLVIKSLHTDAKGEVIEAGRSIYRGDCYDVDVAGRPLNC